jgi:hypothetical protein
MGLHHFRTEAAGSSGALVTIYETARRHILEDGWL